MKQQCEPGCYLHTCGSSLAGITLASTSLCIAFMNESELMFREKGRVAVGGREGEGGAGVVRVCSVC